MHEEDKVIGANYEAKELTVPDGEEPCKPPQKEAVQQQTRL